MKKYLFILFTTSVIYAQDPQTNLPKVYYPVLDEYIKEGYNRNYRAHTRILSRIAYVYFVDLKRVEAEDLYEYKMGSSSSFRVYSKVFRPSNVNVFYICYNENLKDNYYVLRRMVFKTLGIIHGLSECHLECTHIMSQRTVLDDALILYDTDPIQWGVELDILYKELNKHKPELR